MSYIRPASRTLAAAVRAILLVTFVFGVAYTGVITGIGALLFPQQAAGQIIERNGEAVGSALIAQPFLDAQGQPLPGYFQPRPSAAEHNANASGGSNLGPTNPQLADRIAQATTEIAAFNNVSVEQVPADAVTTSASGLDPDISPAYAALQVNRVAAARHLDPTVVTDLVAAHTTGRDLGFLGEPRVNIMELNTALDELGA